MIDPESEVEEFSEFGKRIIGPSTAYISVQQGCARFLGLGVTVVHHEGMTKEWYN